SDTAFVCLLLEEQIAGNFRGFADAEGEQPTCERIECTEVTDLRAVEAVLQRADGSRRAHALRLVDEHDPRHVASSSSSPPWVPRNRSSRRRAVSGVVSYSNRSAGVTRRPSARPAAVRRNAVARSRARCTLVRSPV